jgi:hypothetical protein
MGHNKMMKALKKSWSILMDIILVYLDLRPKVLLGGKIELTFTNSDTDD